MVVPLGYELQISEFGHMPFEFEHVHSGEGISEMINVCIIERIYFSGVVSCRVTHSLCEFWIYALLLGFGVFS